MDWWKSVKEWTGQAKKAPKDELNQSQYSLVSCGKLSEETLSVWLGLPDEVKNDPSLEPFRKYYEKEHGKIIEPSKKSEKIPNKIPLVKSAPILSSKAHSSDEEIQFIDGCTKEDEGNNSYPSSMEKGRSSENVPVFTKPNQMARGKYYTKMMILLACWAFFTACFLMYNEKVETVTISSVSPGQVREYVIPTSDSNPSILIKLTGPFISENAQRRLNSSEMKDLDKLEVWLERSTAKGKETSESWSIPLQEDHFSESEPRSSVLRLANTTGSLAIAMTTTANKTVAFTMSYTENPLNVSTGVTYALVLLCGLYVLIIFEIINRTMAAVLVSTLSLAALASVGERPTVPEIISWLDIETLLLLFSMMLLVSIMAETGIFDFLAVFTFEVTKGKLWPLIYLLCGITAVVSTFLDNVTTVLLMSPVTIRLCEVMDLDPVPILMLMAIYSNIGGTATPVGDPPCVIVASNKAVIQAGINFTNFTAHMALGILLVAIQTSLQVKFMFRDTNKLRLNVPREIQDLRHQISIWRRAAESLPQLSNNAHVVKERLEKKIRKLSVQLDVMVKETSKRACPKVSFKSTLAEMKQKYKIRDKVLLVKTIIAIGFAITVFFLHAIPELNRVSLGWTALLAAILLLILADREDFDTILGRVEWSTLLFFAALFVLMEALSKLGLIQYIGGLMEILVLRVDESARLAVAIMLILWVGGVISAFVDNLPMTTMMIRVVISMGSNPNLNLPLAPLVWALLYGACLGGNGTIIGASANVVCAGVAEAHGYKFTFVRFFKVGFPIMIGHLATASVYLLICHCVFTWH